MDNSAAHVTFPARDAEIGQRKSANSLNPGRPDPFVPDEKFNPQWKFPDPVLEAEGKVLSRISDFRDVSSDCRLSEFREALTAECLSRIFAPRF